MALKDPSDRLQLLHEAAERISSNLVDLELDAGRQLLDASNLQGQTAARWATASSTLTELWRRHSLLEELLRRADELRGRRRAEELDALLRGRAIELASEDVPLAERGLLDSAHMTQRCTAEELVAGMSTMFDDVKSALRSILDELERSAELERGFEGRMLTARELLAAMDRTIADARAERETLLRKISVTTPPPLPERGDGLDDALAEIAELGASGAWLDARRALDELTARAESLIADARQARDAARAPIEARNQFRALLDAYQVKAKRLGRIEDPTLAELFDRAQAALYTAPTDLALAAQLVRSYQEALSGSGATRETAG